MIHEISIPSDDFIIWDQPKIIAPGKESIFQIQYTGVTTNSNFFRLKIVSNDPDENITQPFVYVNTGRFGIGNEAIDFTLNDINTERHGLSDYRGNVVVLVFFASW